MSPVGDTQGQCDFEAPEGVITHEGVMTSMCGLRTERKMIEQEIKSLGVIA